MTRSAIASKQVVEEFWAAMQTNDFRAAARLLSEDFVLDWPQSGERVRGRDDFSTLNENYPVTGRWTFAVRTIIAEGDQAVSDVEVRDESIQARVITFSTIEAGKIVRQVEYWPEPFEPAAWRSEWVERTQS
jgi:ketosteroid isomerase-like protein